MSTTTIEWPPTRREIMAVEFRVLGWRRFLIDTVYWWWISLFNLGFGVPFWLWKPLGLNGWRAYFICRNEFEYPAIHRWYGKRWRDTRKPLPADLAIKEWPR